MASRACCPPVEESTPRPWISARPVPLPVGAVWSLLLSPPHEAMATASAASKGMAKAGTRLQASPTDRRT